MRILANENVPLQVVSALRGAEHDVLWAHTDLRGAEDTEIVRAAVAQSRVLVTFDKDFGELAFRSGLPATSGVILFRIPQRSPEWVAQTVIQIISERKDWEGHFSVVMPPLVRMRPLPSRYDEEP